MKIRGKGGIQVGKQVGEEREGAGEGEGGRQAGKGKGGKKEQRVREGSSVPPVMFLLYRDCWH